MYRPQYVDSSSAVALAESVRNELDRVALEFSQPVDYLALDTIHAQPNRIFEGMIVKADGSTWNPGSGGGIYEYRGGSWRYLEAAGGGGSFTLTTAVQTTATLTVTATSGINVYLCDCASTAITANLPTAVGNTAMLVFKKTDASANAITIDGSGAQTIDGSATAVILTRYTSISLVSDNSNWSII
jgi:hypothetical protein